MRVPGYICVIVCVLAFGLTYWLGSSKYDFVTPPEGYENVERERVIGPKELGGGVDESDNSGDGEVDNGGSGELVDVENGGEVEGDGEGESEEVADSHPSDYLDKKEGGAAGYVALAEKLVADQLAEHSLVAWERVLDSAEPDEKQVKRAYEILKLHKVMTKEEASGIAISIKLHASVPGDLYEKMDKLLAKSAAMIEFGSGYSLSVTHEVSVLTVKRGAPRPAVSLWFSGKNESPRAHFRTKSSRELGLDEKVNGLLFNIVSPYLRQHTELQPLQEMHNEVNAQETLQFLITRHSWRQFGLLLYQDLSGGEQAGE